jgi:hypothetical protein
MYASASGIDKWKELFAKIEVESDAVRGSRGVYVTLVLADEMEEHRRAYPAVDIFSEHEQRTLREQFEKHEREHSSYFEFLDKLSLWIGSLEVLPEGVVPVARMFDGINIVSDKSLGDTVIAVITVLPVNIMFDMSD